MVTKVATLGRSVIAPLIAPVQKVWAVVGPDILQDLDECNNDEAIEASIDADRLTLTAEDPGANLYLKQIVKDHGYNSVVAALCKYVKLC